MPTLPLGGTQGQGIPTGQPLKIPSNDREVKSEERKACEAKGGKWNPLSNTCIMPTGPIQQPEKEDTSKKSGFFTDKETGALTGWTDPKTGATFFNPEAARALAKKQAEEREIPEGTVMFGAKEKQAAEQLRLQQAMSRIGQVGELGMQQEAPIDYSQAATAGAAGAIPGIIGGAIGGATVGALGGPIGAVGGAVLGGVGTFVTGVIGNIKTQQKGELQAAKLELTNARTAMRQLAMLASQDPARADYYINLYNNQLTRLYQAREQTKIETDGDLNSWIEDGREQLAAFDTFIRPGGLAEIYEQKLRNSLQTGIPLTEADLLIEEELL